MAAFLSLTGWPPLRHFIFDDNGFVLLAMASEANEGRAAASLSNICVRLYMFGIVRYPMQFSSS